MIYVTRLNNEEFVVNADLIEFIEKTPDTVISLTTGKKIVVKETPEEIIKKVIDYKKRIFTIVKDKEVL
ncbi:flagellar FlbD family protein [Thermoanaerobacter mathranii subsp. mathranii str. A3]|jgi:flagellar protein FlbD|uniref:Flagellar FlbD family protein n=3 Tax=Thermoanaerobacter TaxID=1754 RepID=D3T2N7_THEIA|nr:MULTISPECIES: flagellar FlbD family protein [Thermoanaerobacter]ADD02489.1 flagellar FlbD family protein [Thermoanaerobacter italicus Ab9]ADH60991.1 flagellar FlbD family protein [Thermoanaerobacter mathranii subsp. mathranii str. A3]MBT1280013.1 flagellar FlbD family protein [Thermoanaerobacter sp. CM-CNRG TB177]MDP9749944.1 flagellar protein FlbD [Thermoanaerobacter pentosaceus]